MFTLRAAAPREKKANSKRRCVVSEGPKEVIVDVARRRIVVPRPKKKADNAPPVKETETTAAPEEVQRKEHGSQTDVSYCQHECSRHPRVNGNGNGDAKTKQNKKGDKDAAKDSGNESGKNDGNGKKNKKKGKDKETETVVQTSSEAEESSDSETDADLPSGSTYIGKRVRIDTDLPSGKKSGNSNKSGKRSGSQNQGSGLETWDPSSLPYLAALLPAPSKMSRGEKVAREAYAQRSRETLAASRSADEEEARRWVSEQLAATHAGALRWLRERDVSRQTAATATAASSALFFDPAELKIALDEADSARRRRSHFVSAAPILRATPDPNAPLWANPDDLEPGGVRSLRSSVVNTPLVLFQDQDQVCTVDGRPVRIVQRAGGRGGNVSLRGGGGAPLRETSGNSASAPASAATSAPRPPNQNQNQNQSKDNQPWGAVNNSNNNNQGTWTNANNNDTWDNEKSDWDNWNQSSDQENQNQEWEKAAGSDNKANTSTAPQEVFDPMLGISFTPAGQTNAALPTEW